MFRKSDKVQLQVELHQARLAAEQTEARLRLVEAEAKQKQDRLQELKCKVRGERDESDERAETERGA